MCGVSCPTPEINCGGTCINPQTSNSNCGASGNCTGGSAGVACTGDTVCGAGVCAPDCPATFTNCSGTCVDEQNDPKHCGGCGPCAAVANDATPVCVTGGCGTGTCEPGFADCNLLYSDGCERDLLTDPANCGACGHVCPGGGSAGCSAGNCTLPCTTTVTSLLNVTSTYASAISVTYAMIGGGGGAGGASTGGAAGGGGGSSAILNAGALVSFASGGNGGADSLATLDPGTNGTAVSGTFVLAPGANLTAYVGGGGGAGGYDWGGGGGSGYFGGAGGEDYSTFVAGGAGGSNVGGVGIGEAGNGTSLAGGNGNPQNGEGGLGGTAGTGGAGGLTAGGDQNDGGGGGGGFGGGGGASSPADAVPATAGGSNGAGASNTIGTAALGGLGASTWSASTSLPASAGAGGQGTGQGGNAGLVILSYVSPTGVCSL